MGRFKPHCCQRCGHPVGYLGRVFQFFNVNVPMCYCRTGHSHFLGV